MRILHTADWHIGKTLRGRSRLDEQEAVLEEILLIAEEERVDCVLVAGDLFDSPAPSAEAERLVFQFWAELIGRQIPAAVIAGNHDHPKRLQALSRLVEPFGLHIRPDPAPPDGEGLVTIRAGEEQALIAALPFISEKRVISAQELLGVEEETYRSYEERVAALIQALCARFRGDTINLLLAHFYVRGARASGSERAIHVSAPYEVGADSLPPSIQYAALGHLHRPQPISPSPVPARYAGSPLQLDFGEQGQRKEVVLLDVQPGEKAQVRSVPLTRGRQLGDIRGTLADLPQQAADCGNAFLRVTVEVEEPVPGIAAQVRELVPNAIDIRVQFPRRESAENPPRMGHLPPEALFAQFYNSQHGVAPPASVQKLFRELYQEAIDEAR